MNTYEAKQGLKTFLFLLLGTGGVYYAAQLAGIGPSGLLRARVNNPPQDVRILAVTESSAALMWVTSKESTGFVAYGTTPNLGQALPLNDRKEKTHLAALTGLSPNQTYYFKIGVGEKLYGQAGSDTPFTFTTRSP